MCLRLRSFALFHALSNLVLGKRLKFVKIGEDYQEYRLSIPETMLTEAIKQSESYQMFIKYSTGQIPPKKSRGKGLQRKKTADESQETVDVSKESELEPESVRKKTSSKRRVKKKVTLSADDNIISDDPDIALELGKSISQTKAEEAEAARQKNKAADIMQAFKDSKKTSKRQPGTRGSNKGTGTIPRVPNESTVVSATSSEGTGTKPGVPDEEKEITKENVILEWRSEQESEYSDEDKLDDVEKDDKEGDADDEDDETKDDEEDIYKYTIRVRKDEDEEMINVEVDDSHKGDKEVTDAAKADTKKTSEVKDGPKKTKLPPTSSSLSISSGFGDQFLKLSSNSSLVMTVKDTTDAEINSLLEVKIQSEVPHNQSTSMLSVPVFVISELLVLTPVRESPLIATVTTLHPSSVSTTPFLRVAKLEKYVFDLKKIDFFAKDLATLKTQVPSVIDNYLGSKQIHELPKKQTSIDDLEQESEKTPLEILKIKKNKLRCRRCRSLLSSLQTRQLSKTLIDDENIMDKGVADTVQDHKRKHDDNEDDDDEDPPAGPNQGKHTKRRRTKDSESLKKPSTTKETHKGKAPSKGSKTGLAYNLLKGTCSSSIELEYHFQKCFNALTDRIYWNNPEGDRYPFDLSKPLPLQGHPDHLIVAADYFFNNNLEYLKSSDLERTYTTSQLNKLSKHNVYSTKKILRVKSVSVKKLHGYGHLEEIMVKRVDHQFYKFKEGDLVDLHLNDIEDMLLLDVQHKLFHLTDSDIVDFIVALRMFTRSLVIKKRVKDLQLGVESYQKKLNITPPQQTFLKIKFKELYTPSHNPLRVIYEDLTKQKRVMWADEMYKFSDGTLKKVWNELHHRIRDFRLEYNTEMLRRKWTAIDRKWSELMVELIDKQMCKRRII
ncbi:hypothetical protein Tco_1328489 [Tanacetum coccineum]